MLVCQKVGMVRIRTFDPWTNMSEDDNFLGISLDRNQSELHVVLIFVI